MILYIIIYIYIHWYNSLFLSKTNSGIEKLSMGERETCVRKAQMCLHDVIITLLYVYLRTGRGYTERERYSITNARELRASCALVTCSPA